MAYFYISFTEGLLSNLKESRPKNNRDNFIEHPLILIGF